MKLVASDPQPEVQLDRWLVHGRGSRVPQLGPRQPAACVAHGNKRVGMRHNTPRGGRVQGSSLRSRPPHRGTCTSRGRRCTRPLRCSSAGRAGCPAAAASTARAAAGGSPCTSRRPPGRSGPARASVLSGSRGRPSCWAGPGRARRGGSARWPLSRGAACPAATGDAFSCQCSTQAPRSVFQCTTPLTGDG